MSRKLNYGVTLGTLLMVTGLVAWKNGGINSKGPLDTAMFIVFIAFFAWLLTPSKDKAAAGEQPNQGVLFRLGKALNGVRRGRDSGL